MKSRIDPDTIARAMKAAAVVAKTGTREERSGKFTVPKAKAAMLTSAKHAAR